MGALTLRLSSASILSFSACSWSGLLFNHTRHRKSPLGSNSFSTWTASGTPFNSAGRSAVK